MPTAGSVQLQNILFGVAVLFLLYELWRGWQFGVVRGIFRLLALCCAWMGGSAAAGATGTVLTLFSKVPPLLAPAVAALVVGLGIYMLISFMAGLLFKRTEHHQGLVRFFFGLGGTVCGLLYGLAIVCGAIMLIRGLGSYGEFRIAQALAAAKADRRLPPRNPAALFLMRLKASLEMGSAGQTLKDFDPLPTSFYDNIVKFSKLYGNDQAMQRFLQYPDTQQLLANPKVVSLLKDPEMAAAAQTHDYLPLFQDKQLRALLEDADFMSEIKRFDFTAALDFALTPPVQAQPASHLTSLIPVQAARIHGIKIKHPVSPNSPPGPGHGTNPTSPFQTAP